jgi:tight adherence protein C
VIFLIALLTFLSTAAFATYLLRPRSNLVRERILEGASPNDIARERVLQGGPIERLILPSAKRFGTFLAGALPQNFVKGIDRMLIMANQPMSLAAFLFFWFLMIAGAALLLLAIVRLNPSIRPTQLIVFGGLIMLFGSMAPCMILRRRARHRQRRIEKSLPDALDLLVASMEAGLGVDAAFSLVARRSSGPLAETLVDYLRRVSLGRTRREALEEVAQRSGVDELIRLSTTVAQATDVGSSMGDALRLQAQELRTRRRMRAHEAAQKAPVWMVIPLALCFLPAMVAVVIVPSILNLLKFIEDLGGG